MPFVVKYYPDVLSEDIPALSPTMSARIRKAIETRLMHAPQDYGEPLRKTLKGYLKLRVGDYRIVFKVRENIVQLIGIDHRNNIYERMFAKLKS